MLPSYAFIPILQYKYKHKEIHQKPVIICYPSYTFIPVLIDTCKSNKTRQKEYVNPRSIVGVFGLYIFLYKRVMEPAGDSTMDSWKQNQVFSKNFKEAQEYYRKCYCWLSIDTIMATNSDFKHVFLIISISNVIKKVSQLQLTYSL